MQFQVFKDTFEPGVNKSLWYGHDMLVAFVCDPPRLQCTRLLSSQNTDNRSVKPKSSSADRHRPCLPALGFIDPLCLSGERERVGAASRGGKGGSGEGAGVDVPTHRSAG